MKNRNFIGIKLLFFVLATVVCLCNANAQVVSQVGNPTNAYWDGYNLPMKNVGTTANPVWALYSGDINQDGTVSGDDMNEVEYEAGLQDFGYLQGDITGDGAVSGDDMNLIELNAGLQLYFARPY